MIGCTDWKGSHPSVKLTVNLNKLSLLSNCIFVSCIWFSWDGVNFPHYAVLCIGDWKGVGNTPVCTATASASSLSSIPSSHTSSRLGVGKSWEGTYPGHLTSTDQRDMPYYRMFGMSADRKANKRRRKQEQSLFTVSVLQSNCYTCWSSASWELSGHHLMTESRE